MSDQIKIQQSASPWQPTDDARIVETFLLYDFPRSGILEQEGNKYLFICLDQFDHHTLWAYVLIDDNDVSTLRRGSRQALKHFNQTNRPITILSAVEGEGIVYAARYSSLGSTFAESALLSLTQALEELQREEVLQAKAG